MAVINILSPHVADLIAAGEVVERPASVVKELVENSIDAGARNITVSIRGGGMREIRVTDDGCGMSPEDAGIAFLRHATSKLRDERGLEAIGTLGFRGEALAAISSVSRIQLTTREHGAAEGTRLALSAGEIDEMGPAGCPEGSSMVVRDLFYNTPARQKFVKSDRAEAGACAAAALRCALGHPEVALHFLRDGEEQFFSPGDGSAKNTVYSLLGRETALSLLECAGESGGVSVSGFVSAPHAGRGSRNMQFFFLNGRAFRSLSLQTAVEQAYKNSLLSGRFPACVLYLRLGTNRVDVNVHPTKLEVRFTEEKAVFEAVYGTVRAALEERSGASLASLRLDRQRSAPPAPPREKARSVPGSLPGDSGLPAPAQPAPPAPAPERTGAPAGFGSSQPPVRYDLRPGPSRGGMLTFRQSVEPPGSTVLVPRPEIPRASEEKPAPTRPPAAPAEASADHAPTPVIAAPADREAEKAPGPGAALSPETPPWRLIGEALDTYILVETGEELLLIDKHACHERILFDKLLAGLGPQMSQTLLSPLTWSPGAETAELLEQNSEALVQAGFEVERFGEDGVILRSVPMDLAGSELAALEEIAAALDHGRAEDPREEILHTVACKAAIKAGTRSDPRELAALAERVVRGEIRYCPHGRPVAVRLSRRELDRQFKRIV